jgi:hypothetical protein
VLLRRGALRCSNVADGAGMQTRFARRLPTRCG